MAHYVGEFFGLLEEFALEGLEVFRVDLFLQVVFFGLELFFHICANKSLSTLTTTTQLTFLKRQPLPRFI